MSANAVFLDVTPKTPLEHGLFYVSLGWRVLRSLRSTRSAVHRASIRSGDYLRRRKTRWSARWASWRRGSSQDGQRFKPEHYRY